MMAPGGVALYVMPSRWTIYDKCVALALATRLMPVPSAGGRSDGCHISLNLRPPAE